MLFFAISFPPITYRTTQSSGVVLFGDLHVESSANFHRLADQLLDFLGYRCVGFDKHGFTLSIPLTDELMSGHIGIGDAPAAVGIGSKIGADDGEGAVGGKGEGNGTTEAGRRAGDCDNTGCETSGQQSGSHVDGDGKGWRGNVDMWICQVGREKSNYQSGMVWCLVGDRYDQVR